MPLPVMMWELILKHLRGGKWILTTNAEAL